MKWNRTTDYAIRTMEYLASEGKITPSTDLAHHLKVNQQTVIQTAAPLVSAGLLCVLPGIHGGYYLAKDPRTMSLYEIISAVEHPELFPENETKDKAGNKVDMIYRILQNAFDSIFGQVSVWDLLPENHQIIDKLIRKALNEVLATLPFQAIAPA